MTKYGWLLVSVLLCVGIISAQDCGVVDNIAFPVNPDSFELAQDYAVASPRHQGRYHTGEDWYGGRDMTYGQPVRAAARGRVTYSFANGWGRDKGVVIIEHTLPDDTVFYTQYGHMEEVGTYTFPQRLSCVEQGTVIGAIGDVRPAPHLHFEVRVSGGDNPGAGYSRDIPFDEGYRNPSKYIQNLQGWLNQAHRWHITIGTDNVINEQGIAPPLILNDNSLLYLDGAGTTVRRATNDGRVLWRVRLENPAVAVLAWQGASTVIFADGTMQSINVETGTLGDAWRVPDVSFTNAPLNTADNLIFPVANNTLVALSNDRRSVLWRTDNIPSIAKTQFLPDGSFGLLTEDDEIILIDPNGAVVHRSQLQQGAGLAQSPTGTLLVYSLGGLWEVNFLGEWSLYITDAPEGGESAALALSADGTRLYTFDGQSLRAYRTDDKVQVWNAGTPAVSGHVNISLFDEIILLTSSMGDVRVFTNNGSFCNLLDVWGTPTARQWLNLGADNVLRLTVADQLLGLDWVGLTRACRI